MDARSRNSHSADCEDALLAIAKKAMERKTGARGLRTILENVLLDTMYDLPSSDSAKKVVVDESVVTGETSPYVIYESDESPVMNALTKQYRKLFDMEGVELEFREDALLAIAKKAMERKTGARGLRTILENVLLDTMYDLPSSDSAKKVVVDESVVTGETSPYVIYESDESPTVDIEQP